MDLDFVLSVSTGFSKRKIYLQSLITENTMAWSRVDAEKLGSEDEFWRLQRSIAENASLQLNGNEKALGLGQGTQSSEWDMVGLSHVLIQLCGSFFFWLFTAQHLCFY